MADDETRRPPLAETDNERQQQRSAQPQVSDELSPLLRRSRSTDRGYGDAPDIRRSPLASSSLGSLKGKKRARRWPSIIAFTLLSILVVLILCLGFAGPAVVKEYAREATTFKPTGLSIEEFTSTGVRARVRGTLVLDGSKVRKKAVRDLGRAATWIAREVETKESQIGVILPEYGDVLLGTAVVPPFKVDVREGVENHIDVLCDLSAGDLNGLRNIANDWINDKIGRLFVRARAWVSIQSGIFSLGPQKLDQNMIFGEGDVPSMPGYDIEDISFRESKLPPALRAAANISVQNDFPVMLDVPSLAFEILIAGCLPDQPFLQIANATTDAITIEPHTDVRAHVDGTIVKLSDVLTSTCPDAGKSPLDALLGGYIQGDATKVYVKGSDQAIEDTPPWISEFLSDLLVPLEFRGKELDKLIRNFTLEDVHFALPSPFSGPSDPDSDPRITARVKAIVNLPDEIEFDVNIKHVKANSDIFYHEMKLGELDLRQWHNASSERLDELGQTSLLVSANITDAPINITDSDVLADVIQAVIFGNDDVLLSVDAAVDVQAETAIGELVAREIPASGDFYVNR